MEENILDILFEVDEGVCWDDYLDKIQEGMKSYQNAMGEGVDPENYLTPILSTYWEVFHTHNIYRRNNGTLLCPEYDVGIFLVGFSTLPIVLSLAEIQPTKEIYFLYSSDTINMLSEISNRISVMLPGSTLSSLVACSIASPNHALEIDGSSDPVQTFKRIKEVIDKVGDKRIALDLTGGKKTMLGGGFTGGAIFGIADSVRSSDCNMFYVDSLEYSPLHRAPTPGTEFLNLLENPYDIYNVQSVQQAEKLFEKHNYEASAVLWDSVDKKLNSYAERFELENEHEAVQKNLSIADCYSYWDAFDYIEAMDSKKKCGSHWDYNAKHTYNAIDVLNILSEVEDTETLFDNNARIIHYAVDRYQNGIRRRESDRFDDATVRFTQVVEILCRYEVYQIAINNSLTDIRNNHEPVLSEDCRNEEWKITKLIRFLFNQYRTYEGRYQIANTDRYLQLNSYGYGNIKQITNIIKPRNEFVHVKSNPGWKKMEENAENLLKLAKKFLKNFSDEYCSNNDLSFDDLLELHRFRR